MYILVQLIAMLCCVYLIPALKRHTGVKQVAQRATIAHLRASKYFKIVLK